MPRKLLKFGGPNLGPGQHTFTRFPAGHAKAGQIRPDVAFGQSLPADEIEDAQGYLDRGQASVIDDPLDTGGPPAQHAGEAKKHKGNV